MKISLILPVLLFFSVAYADDVEVIEFPQEELATETVLPVFEHREVVKNRLVTTAKRIELGGGIGMSLTEALYNNLGYNLNATYHFDETHGLNVSGIFMLSGLSNMGNDLKEGRGLEADKFDASLAPHPSSFLFANYQFTAYYGKISLTKKTVMNLSAYALAGIGSIAFGDSNAVGLNFGLGQKVYLTPNLALRFDLKMMAYSGPDPTTAALNDGVPVSSADLTETTFFPIHLNAGLVYLL